MTKLSEFELIERYFRQLGQSNECVALGVGDDCAVIDLPQGKQLCISVDTMLEGVHFPVNCSPDLIAHRALAAALSDLAAMGATPSHFTLALTIPTSDEVWLASFAEGLAGLANKCGVELVGGDTTCGPLSVSIQVHGFVYRGAALVRSGAVPGDVLAVTGTLGDAGAGLSLLEGGEGNVAQQHLLGRYNKPEPRLKEGSALSSFVSACIDISDGLLADAAHIAKASNCQLTIDQERLPLSSALLDVFPEHAVRYALSAGDDYELLIALSESNWLLLQEMHPTMQITRIGEVSEGKGVLLRRDGKEIAQPEKGYQHFE